MKKSAKNDVRYKLWDLLQRTNSLLLKWYDVKFLREIGISYQQFLVLLMMDRIGKESTGSQIADMLERNPNTLSMIFDRMAEAGLVERARDMKDRRQVRIIMTQKGKNQFKKAAELATRVIEQLAEPFSKEDLQTFVSLTDKLRAQTFKVLVPQKELKRAGVIKK